MGLDWLTGVSPAGLESLRFNAPVVHTTGREMPPAGLRF